MSEFQAAKLLVRQLYERLDAADSAAAVQSACSAYAPRIVWRGYHPFNEITDPVVLAETFWMPLRQSMKHLHRRLDLFFAGRNEIDDFSSVWVGSMGHLMGLFDEPWLGIKPTRRIAMLRYAAFHKVEDGQITEEAMFFDIPHLMMQAGQNPFPPQTGAHLVQPGPMTHNGVLFDDRDPAEGKETLRVINHMIGDIGKWSGGRDEPLVDELRRSWTEDMIWWGPAGIGSAYTIERYAEQHSGPFRKAFINRTFNGHICKIAEGDFGGFFGWPNLTLTNHGGFMGMPATGRTGDMRVIDMYRRDGDKLAENWVFIDLLHFWNQQGLDVLGRLSEV